MKVSYVGSSLTKCFFLGQRCISYALKLGYLCTIILSNHGWIFHNNSPAPPLLASIYLLKIFTSSLKLRMSSFKLIEAHFVLKSLFLSPVNQPNLKKLSLLKNSNLWHYIKTYAILIAFCLLWLAADAVECWDSMLSLSGISRSYGIQPPNSIWKRSRNKGSTC